MKVGLVLSGGGAKGSYEAGVIKALTEAGLNFNVIAGTSVGGLNAVLLASNQIKDMIYLWEHIENDDIYSTKLEFKLGIKTILMLLVPVLAIFWVRRYVKEKLVSLNNLESIKSTAPLKELILKVVDCEKVFKNKNTLILTGTNLQLGTEDLFIKTDTGKLFINNTEIGGNYYNVLRDMLLATSSIPVLFPPQRVINYQYVDGGVGNNFPLMPVIKQGCDVIFMVMLSPENFAEDKVFNTLTSIGGRSFSILLENTMREDIKHSEFINKLIPKVSIGRYKPIKYVTIRPLKKIDVDMLDFNPTKSKMYIQQGYTDTLEVLKGIKDKDILNLFRRAI